MLRNLMGLPRRVSTGLFLETSTAINGYCEFLRSMDGRHKLESKYYRLELWAAGLLDALNELEQSKFAADKYSTKVFQKSTETMELQELEYYQLHVYFYKNAIIRVFAILDKLGNFMNDLFELETEKVKERFSYYTVLRHMYKLELHPVLEKKLFQLKEAYEEPMNKLRQKRNMEIHYLNIEMLDDLKNMSQVFSEGELIEDLPANIADLEQGYEMVCHSLMAVFTYALVHHSVRSNS
jgi:SepF-like predicted cell division protein (DUF552 family)